MLAGRVAHDQRADADEVAVAVDQRRAAPGTRRRARPQRLVEHVLPVAGERPLRDDPRERRLVDAAVRRDHHRIGFRQAPGRAERDRRRVEGHDRAQQAEAARVIVADDLRRQHAPAVVGDRDLVGLDDQVADRHDQPVAVDQHAAALALAAEGGCAARIGHRSRAHLDHRAQERGGVGGGRHLLRRLRAGFGGGRAGRRERDGHRDGHDQRRERRAQDRVGRGSHGALRRAGAAATPARAFGGAVRAPARRTDPL